MNSVIYNEYGGVEGLQIVKEPVPSLRSPDDILIQVKAIGINPLDLQIMEGRNHLFRSFSGSNFPKRIGADFSGIIVQLGSSVVGFNIHDEVFGSVDPFTAGAAAEYIIVDDKRIVRKPTNITYEQACALPISGTAALTSARLGKIRQGSEILINGCTGGVGIFLLQIAKKAGAVVTGVCSSSGSDIAKSLGCDFVIDYRAQDAKTLSKQFDVVIDLTSKWSYKDVAHMMKPEKAKFLDFSPSIGKLLSQKMRNIFAKHKVKLVLSQTSKESLETLRQMATEDLHIYIGKSFTLDEAKEAYAFSKGGSILGKAVIVINGHDNTIDK